MNPEGVARRAKRRMPRSINLMLSVVVTALSLGTQTHLYLTHKYGEPLNLERLFVEFKSGLNLLVPITPFVATRRFLVLMRNL